MRRHQHQYKVTIIRYSCSYNILQYYQFYRVHYQYNFMLISIKWQVDLNQLPKYNLMSHILKLHFSPVSLLCLCYIICHFIANNKTNKCPSQREFKEWLTSNVAHKWFPIGIGLGMSGEKLEEIRENSNDIPDQCLGNLFYEWEQNPHKDKPFTWDTLIQVLRSVKVGEEFLAKKLEEHFSKWQW